MRGALRTSRHARWDAVDAELAKDERKVSRTAKACGSGTATLVSSSREASFSGATVARKPVRREEHVISRKPSRREGRVFSAGPVCSCALFFAQFAHETAGAARIRSSLRPLLLTRAKIQANLGHFVPRECGVLSFGWWKIESRPHHVIASSVPALGRPGCVENQGDWRFDFSPPRHAQARVGGGGRKRLLFSSQDGIALYFTTPISRKYFSTPG
jgi:hypothetical protein